MVMICISRNYTSVVAFFVSRGPLAAARQGEIMMMNSMPFLLWVR